MLLFFCVLPLAGYARIVIEERVEIAPQNLILPNNPTQNYNFRVEVDWDAEEVQANNHFWDADLQVNTVLKNSCDQIAGETGFIYGWPTGTSSLEINANAYSYEILVTVSGFYDSYQFVDLTVRTYLNIEQLNTFTHRVNSGIWPYFSESVTSSFYQYVYLVDDFNFSVDDEIMEYGCFYLVDLRTNYDNTRSSSVVANLANDPVTLTILQGSEYLTFYDNRTEEDVGSTVQVMYNDIGEIDLRYQNPLRDTISRIAVIQLESNGIVETDSIEILPAPDDLNVWVSPEEISTGEEASVNIFLDYCPPFETKINIEIIKGQEYGSLIDPISTNKTQIITNLEHFFGFAWVDYTADSISSEVSDSVIFRVTTSDPEIVPKEAILIIKPPPIYAYTVPEVLGADDTADVFIKHRLEDGTLEDFPPEQTFELGVLDGCINGNFMVDDSINVYFADALQPIKFVTADVIDTTYDKVLIRVGADLGGSGEPGGSSSPVGNIVGEEEKVLTEKRRGLDTLRAGFEKMIAEKKAEAEAKKKKDSEPPIEAPIVAACVIEENMIYSNYYKRFTSVRDECDYPLCGENQPNYTFSLQTHENNFIKSEDGTKVEVCNSPNPNELGGSEPVEYLFLRQNSAGEWEKNWLVEYCLNSNNEIQYKLIDPSSPVPTEVPIIFDFVRDRCVNKIGNRILIKNLMEVGSKVTGNTDYAMEDFCGHYCYNIATREYGYVIEAVIIEHENSHRDQYQEIINNSVAESLFSRLSNLSYSCDFFNKHIDNPE